MLTCVLSVNFLEPVSSLAILYDTQEVPEKHDDCHLAYRRDVNGRFLFDSRIEVLFTSAFASKNGAFND